MATRLRGFLGAGLSSLALLGFGFGHGPAAAQPAASPPTLELQFPGPPTALDTETFYQLLLGP